jgi:hypothetical protein
VFVFVFVSLSRPPEFERRSLPKSLRNPELRDFGGGTATGGGEWTILVDMKLGPEFRLCQPSLSIAAEMRKKRKSYLVHSLAREIGKAGIF